MTNKEATDAVLNALPKDLREHLAGVFQPVEGKFKLGEFVELNPEQDIMRLFLENNNGNYAQAQREACLLTQNGPLEVWDIQNLMFHGKDTVCYNVTVQSPHIFQMYILPEQYLRRRSND